LLKVKISIEDDKGKRAEIELSEADNLSKLVIIQNVFNLFGIDTDVLEMTNTFNRIGKAYSSFFNQVNPIEITKEEIENISNEIKQQMIKGLTLEKEELENTYKETKDQPEYVRTGIKIRNDGTKLYRCRYQCIACWNRGTHYIHRESKRTWCHRCLHEMTVYPAHPDGVSQDTFGNFFRAGDYKDWNLSWDK